MDDARAQMLLRIMGHEVRFSDFQFSEFLNHFDYIEFIMNLARQEHQVISLTLFILKHILGLV